MLSKLRRIIIDEDNNHYVYQQYCTVDVCVYVCEHIIMYFTHCEHFGFFLPKNVKPKKKQSYYCISKGVTITVNHAWCSLIRR